MSETGEDEKSAQSKKNLSILLQAMGLFDAIFGLALALLGPRYIGGDPTVDMVLMIGGGFFFVIGPIQWWYGRFRIGASSSDENAGTVVRTRR